MQPLRTLLPAYVVVRRKIGWRSAYRTALGGEMVGRCSPADWPGQGEVRVGEKSRRPWRLVQCIRVFGTKVQFETW